MKCVLLSGGGGTRLWPLSTKESPKQYLQLPDGRTIFAKTVERNRRLFESFTVITNRKYRQLTEKELTGCGLADSASLVLEPCPRNTAPAVAVAALLSDPDEVLLVAPTDHYITGMDQYASAISEAERLAQQGSLVVFGVEPTSPHTGYGYINHDGFDVKAFKEKPDLDTAKRYLAEGGYLWNSGMLAFKAGVMLEELASYCPDILEACKKVLSGSQAPDNVLPLNEELFSQVRAESIDYAVIERSRRVKVVPARFEWFDLGSLRAFGVLADDGPEGNRALGEQVVVHECVKTSVFNGSSHMKIVVNGLEDVIVAVTDDAVYVTRADSADQIKDVDNWV